MELEYWKEVTETLKKYLHLMYTPVGIKWVRTEEELMSIPKVRIHEKHYAPCVVVGQALQFGWTVACKPENVHNNYCRGVNGMLSETKNGIPEKYSRVSGTATVKLPCTSCRFRLYPP